MEQTEKFENLPYEIILKIFSHLSIKDLCQCMAVNEKLRAIASDEHLWEKLRFTSNVPAKLLKILVDKKCKYLCLELSTVLSADIKFENNSTLKYLCLEENIEENRNFEVLPNLAVSCFELEKLSFGLNELNDGSDEIELSMNSKYFQAIIQNCSTLQALSLPLIKMNLNAAHQIIISCQALSELCLFQSVWSQDSIDFLCENLTSNIGKLGLSGHKTFGNEQLNRLLTRCNNLTEFGFGCTAVTNENVIVEHLSKTLTKVRPSDMLTYEQMFKIAAMPNIQNFDASSYKWLTDEGIQLKQRMQYLFPNMKIHSKTLIIGYPYPSVTNPFVDTYNGFWEIKANLSTCDGQYFCEYCHAKFLPECQC